MMPEKNVYAGKSDIACEVEPVTRGAALHLFSAASFLVGFLMRKGANLHAIFEASPQPSQRCMQGNFSHRLGRKNIDL